MHDEAHRGEITPELIEQTLEELNQQEIFHHLRSNVKGNGNYFDPDKGFVEEFERRPADKVLDAFVEAINKGVPEALRGFIYPEEAKQMSSSLAKGSVSRRIVEAYYRIGSDTSLTDAENNITGKKSYERMDFPSEVEVDYIFATLQAT